MKAAACRAACSSLPAVAGEDFRSSASGRVRLRRISVGRDHVTSGARVNCANICGENKTARDYDFAGDRKIRI